MTKEGKVLRILDEFRVVVSLGSQDVKIGDKLIIYTLGVEIKDESGQSLGRLEIVKANVEIEHIQDKFSVAVSPLISETVREQVPSLWSQYLASTFTTGLGGSTERVRVVTKREPLPVEAVSETLDRTIHIGDLVRTA